MRHGAAYPKPASVVIAATLAVGLCPLPLAAQGPLSAIEWLQDSVLVPDQEGLQPVTPPTGDAWMDGVITMRPLDRVQPDSVGLFPAARVGLPRDFWQPSTAEELAPLVADLPEDTLPALRTLAYRLLLAEFDAPRGDAADEQSSPLLSARIDKLYDFGALDQAVALLDTLDSRDAALKLRWLEIALLLGDETPVCERVLQSEAPFPFEAARIYCQARGGDWAGAESAYMAARDSLPAPYGELLARFLEVEGHVDHEPMTPIAGLPAQLSPLAWRMREAIGESVATHGLPVAFAHADLRGTVGWRAQIEAAERLVRSGALTPNRLLGLYTERAAAASGGIWDRVRAVQRLETALSHDDPDEIGAALIHAWTQMAAAELEMVLVSLFTGALRDIPLDGDAAATARAMNYLSDEYEDIALAETAEDPHSRLLAAVARGLPPDPEAAGDPTQAAVVEAFAETSEIPASAHERLTEGRNGEEALRVLGRIGSGGDPRMLGEGLALLRYMGFEDIARRAALQALLLERRG